MAVWPMLDSGLGHQVSATPATSVGTVTVTASATVNTKGAWTELVASTTQPGQWLMLLVAGPYLSAADRSSLLDVGVGPVGSELVVLPDVQVGYAGGKMALPLAVPAGSRLVARMASAVASVTAAVEARVISCAGVVPLETLARATTYGVVAAASKGTTLATVTSANTKGAWTELVASTTSRGRWALVTVQGVGAATITSDGLVDVGVGAAGAESVIVADTPFALASNESIDYTPGTAGVDVPAGSRLVARYASSSTTAGAAPAVAVTLLD